MILRKRKKAIALLMLIVFVTLITPIRDLNVQAITTVLDLKHELEVDVNKTWKIKLNRELDEKIASEIQKYVVVAYNYSGVAVSGVDISYDKTSKSIVIKPPQEGYRYGSTFTITIKSTLIDKDGKAIEQPVVKEFSTPIKPGSEINTALGEITYYNLGYTLEEFIDKQMNINPYIVRSYYGGNAERNDLKVYMDPDRIKVSDYSIYQFLKLNYIEGITAENLNNAFSSNGILSQTGKDFMEASKIYNINPAYLVAHAIHETGNGTSQLAKGADFKAPDGSIVKVYNFFGIGAYDVDPINLGAKKAYEEGWFTPKDAILGGAKFIGNSYINNSMEQNTLYEMKWNVHNFNNPGHQYATDIAWSYKQVEYIKNILAECPNAKLEFEIPIYKRLT